MNIHHRCRRTGLRKIVPSALALMAGTLAVCAAVKGLYTPPSPESPGGIEGTVSSPALPIAKVVAIPADAPDLAYEGEVSGSDRRTFTFTGLPMRRYDLVVFYESCFYEGLTLHRGADTLTPDDRAAITRTVEEAEPFFTGKIVHRLQGETGRGGEARCICTFYRDKSSIERLDFENSQHRRTFKLVVLRQVGPGWQIVAARDLHPMYVQPGETQIPHHFSESLNRIRVTNKIKRLGQLVLDSR